LERVVKSSMSVGACCRASDIRSSPLVMYLKRREEEEQLWAAKSAEL